MIRRRHRPSWIGLVIFLGSHLATTKYHSLAFADHGGVLYPKSWLPLPIKASTPATPWCGRGGASTATLLCRGGARDDNEHLPEPCPSVDLPEHWAEGSKRALVLMDKTCPYFGFYMTRMANEAWGIAVINVFSDYFRSFFIRENEEEALSMCMPNEQQLDEWKSKLKLAEIDEIVGVYCESDSGLADAEKFACLLGVTHHNGINDARRNKYLMNEAVAKAGLATVRQKLCRTLQEATEFAQKELGVLELHDDTAVVFSGEAINGDEGISGDTKTSDDTPEEELFSNTGALLGRGVNADISTSPLCICKPARGAASENVVLCKDLSDVKRGFEMIHGSTIFGSPFDQHEDVLVQEFLCGTEFALDIVSRDGEHKVAALWRYDKRPANGAPFVYYATEMIDGNNSQARAISEYAKKALDALDFRYGLTHVEVIVDRQGPRLVEVNCRQHNTDFAPLAMACLGYNALDMTLAAFLGGQKERTFDFDQRDEMRLDWDTLPDLPVTRMFGAIVHLVSSVEGNLVDINSDALQEIEEMESVLEMEIYPPFLEIGSQIKKTVDIRSDAGWVHLINDNKDDFRRDYDRIVELMPSIFVVG